MSDKWYISGPLGIGATEPSESLQVDGSIYVQGEGRGLIVDESNGGKRIGFLKYNGREAGIWRVANQDFEIGRRLDVSNLPGSATPDSANMVTDLYIAGNGNVGIANELTVGAGGNAVLRTRHIEGKQGGIDDPDTLYLNWGSGKDVQIGEPSRKSNLFVCGNVGIGTPNPTSARLQFDNNGGDKVVIFDAGATNRYGFGLNTGNLNVFVPAEGRFSVRQNDHNGTEVMSVTGTGNVGIGTANPTSARLQFDNRGGDKVVVYDAGPTDRYGFGLNSGNLNAFVPAGGRFSIRQNGHDGTEVMAVSGTGNVGIGTISPDVSLHLGDRVPGAQARIQLDNANGQKAQINRWTNRLEIKSTDEIIHAIDTDVQGSYKEVLIIKVEGIAVNGQAWKSDGGNWAKPSDIRLKKNIASLRASLDQLLKLRGVIFEWKEPEKHGNLTGVQRGFIAQEVEQVFPEWVGEDSNGSKFLTIYGFEALTIEAFRELKDNIDSLNERIQEIESTVNRNGTSRLEVNAL